METPEERFERILLANLQRVDDFLKYAEAKNGALLTFASVWALGITGFLAEPAKLPSGLPTALGVALFLMVGTGGVAISSFFPRIHLPRFFGKSAESHERSLFFFGDIASMTSSQFEEQVREKYSAPNQAGSPNHFASDLAVQISVNSQITKRKLELFQIGIWLTATATTVVLLPLSWWALKLLLGCE